MARLLVVDDQASVRKAIRALLEGQGHAVTEACDGVEAIECLEGDFDLVVTDVLMPRCDGLELCRHVRQSRPGLPTLVVTAGWSNPGLDLLSVARRLGADRAIAKGSIASALLPAVAELLAAAAPAKCGAGKVAAAGPAIRR